MSFEFILPYKISKKLIFYLQPKLHGCSHSSLTKTVAKGCLEQLAMA